MAYSILCLNFYQSIESARFDKLWRVVSWLDILLPVVNFRFLPIQRLGPVRGVVFVCYDVELFCFFVQKPAVMNPVSDYVLFFVLLFVVSVQVLILDDIFQLKFSFFVLLFLVQTAQCLRQRLIKIQDQRLPINIWWRESFLKVFAMLVAFNFKLIFVGLLLFRIVEFAKDRIVIVSLPIFIHCIQIFLLSLFI